MVALLLILRVGWLLRGEYDDDREEEGTHAEGRPGRQAGVHREMARELLAAAGPCRIARVNMAGEDILLVGKLRQGR